jgi:hypothetical protein
MESTRILPLEEGEKAAEGPRLFVQSSRETRGKTDVAKPFIRESIFVHRRIHALEVEGASTAVTAD